MVKFIIIKYLQDDLKSKGHKFKTNSDTETIVHAYEEYDLRFCKPYSEVCLQ